MSTISWSKPYEISTSFGTRPDSHPQLQEYLTEKLGLVWIADACFLTKELMKISPTPDYSMLSHSDLDAFVKVRCLSWKNTSDQIEDVKSAVQFLISDARNVTVLIKEDGHIVAAASAFLLGDRAYLKGDFVAPERRGHGIYRRLIAARESALFNRGVRLVTGIANITTAAPILLKYQYQNTGSVCVMARTKTPWVSL